MTRSPHQKRVDEFMKLAGQEVPEKPFIPDEEIRILRGKLIIEEALETLEALGLGLFVKDPATETLTPVHEKIEIHPIPNATPSLEKIADGCADVIVVTTGTLSACGIDDEPLQEAVDRNNLAKFGPGGYRRDDGKWVKPPHHQPPDIEGILKSQGWNGEK